MKEANFIIPVKYNCRILDRGNLSTQKKARTEIVEFHIMHFQGLRNGNSG